MKADKAFIRDITADVPEYRHIIRLQGGYWQATFSLNLPLVDLLDIFNNWLGYHLEETSDGDITWEGMIYEMTLNAPEASRIKTLDKLSNSIQVTWTDTGGTKRTSTSATQAQSIARYGQKEELLSINLVDGAAGTIVRDTYLKENCWPWSRPQNQGGGDTSTLDVTACGYIFTGNWRYTQSAIGSASTVHDWIEAIVNYDINEFIKKGVLESNAQAVTRTLTSPARSWDTILELTNLGDSSGNLYHSYVYNGRYLNYRQLDVKPAYQIMNGQITYNYMSGPVNPFAVKPGVFRDVDWPIQNTDPGSYLTDGRDMIIEEVSCGINSGLSWRALDFSEADLMAQRAEFLASSEQNPPAPAKPKKKKKSKGSAFTGPRKQKGISAG